MAASVTPEAINLAIKQGVDILSLTEDHVYQKLPMMVANNQSPYHTAFTVS